MINHQKYSVKVKVDTKFNPSQSSILENKFVFYYNITISNIGKVAAQIINRKWIISNAEGQIKEIQGFDIEGCQPIINPGESFHYSSFTIINSPIETMQGTFYLLAIDGTKFIEKIPPFKLIIPDMVH